MNRGAVPSREGAERGRRCEENGAGTRRSGRNVAFETPAEQPSLGDKEQFLAGSQHRAVWQILDGRRQRMEALASPVEALAVEDGVDCRGAGRGDAVALRPGFAEGLSRVAAAGEAGAVTGGERRRLVEEEELRPTPRRHHGAADALVLKRADE